MPLTTGDVQLYYETRGPRSGAPVLLIQGFTWQMTGWRETFCRKVVERGAFVIMLDNRDVGLSQKFGGRDDHDGGYSMSDMASDGFRVLDELGLASAHVVGASMGGMVAQAMALAQPARVSSLNLIYSAPSLDMGYFIPVEPLNPMDRLKRLDRAEAIEEFVRLERASASTGYPYDEEWVRNLGARNYDRCYAPEGVIRQLMGMIRWQATPEALSDLTMPSSIIHGRADGRVRVQAALDLGRLLKTSEMHIYPGLGHEIPEALEDEFASLIMRTSARV